MSGTWRNQSPCDEKETMRLVDAALDRRRTLLASTETDAIRLFHAAADGIDGLVIEKWADVLIAQLHENRLALGEPALRVVCEYVRRRCDASAVYRKVFPKTRGDPSGTLATNHSDPTPWLGEPSDAVITVVENTTSYLVRPYDGFSVGLFLDQRGNRRRVREMSERREVLNAFAYTGGFSVAAALGGAARTVNVDVSKKALEWGKQNFAANALDLAAHRFIRSDVFDYFRRAQRQGHMFDLVILDPPTFGRSKQTKRPFVLMESLDELVAGAVRLLRPAGTLLLSSNHRSLTRRRLEDATKSAAAERRFKIIARPELPIDFAGDPDYSKSIVARFD